MSNNAYAFCAPQPPPFLLPRCGWAVFQLLLPQIYWAFAFAVTLTASNARRADNAWFALFRCHAHFILTTDSAIEHASVHGFRTFFVVHGHCLTFSGPYLLLAPCPAGGATHAARQTPTVRSNRIYPYMRGYSPHQPATFVTQLPRRFTY